MSKALVTEVRRLNLLSLRHSDIARLHTVLSTALNLKSHWGAFVQEQATAQNPNALPGAKVDVTLGPMVVEEFFDREIADIDTALMGSIAAAATDALYAVGQTEVDEDMVLRDLLRDKPN